MKYNFNEIEVLQQLSETELQEVEAVIKLYDNSNGLVREEELISFQELKESLEG